MVLLFQGTFLTNKVRFLGWQCWNGIFWEHLTGFQPRFNVPASTEWPGLRPGCLEWVVLIVLLFPGTFLTDKVRFLGSPWWNETFLESLTGFQPRFKVPASTEWPDLRMGCLKWVVLMVKLFWIKCICGYYNIVTLFFRLAARGPSLLSDWGCDLLNKLDLLAANQKNKATFNIMHMWLL